MNILFFLSTLLFFIIQFTGLLAQDDEIFLPTIKGNYRTCSIIKYRYNQGNIDLQSKSILTTANYESNRVVEVSSYDSYINKKRIFKYDTLGNRVSVISYNKDGSVNYTYEFVYDNKGKEIQADYREGDAQNTYLVKYMYMYDAKGNKVESLEYKSNPSFVDGLKKKSDSNEIDTKITYKYDDDSNLIEQTMYLHGLSDSITTTYKYDKKRNKIEERMGNKESDMSIIKKFAFDEHKNVIEESFYNPDKSSHGFPHGWTSIEYSYKYDVDGNITEKIVYNPRNKNIVSEVTYKYDDYGNKTEEVAYESNLPYKKIEYIYSK